MGFPLDENQLMITGIPKFVNIIITKTISNGLGYPSKVTTR